MNALSDLERSRFKGNFALNLLQFGRALRRAGLPIGSGQIIDAARGVIEVGVATRADLFWTLSACFVRRKEEHLVFDELFELFFRDPFSMSKAHELLLSKSSIPDDTRLGAKKSATRRAKDALKRDTPKPPETPKEKKKIEYDVTMTASEDEIIRTRDFEKMSAAEIDRAREAIRRMPLPRATVLMRRLKPDPRGTRLDVRRTLQATLRAGGDSILLRRRGFRERPPPLVALCDVSGSMERYSRMVLHFLHALSRSRPRVSSFVFGTKLTNITRLLKERDVDEALAAVGREVTDWAGGTRIGDSLRLFNKVWSRRVLGQGAVVLLITDGLERGDATQLEREAERLQKSCRRLVWLNPLLRWDGFEPRAAGVRAILRHVDDFRTVHHLGSLEELAQVLGAEAPRRGRTPYISSMVSD